MFVRKLTYVLSGLLAGAMMALPSAQAATTFNVQVITAGSSAQWGVFAEAAYQLAKAQGNAKHYTVKGGIKTCGSTTNGGCVYLNDTRNTNIQQEPGNIWVVWSETSGNVWAYLSVDSIVGVRAFSAYPRANLAFVAQSALPAAGSNALAVWDDGSLDSALDAAVYTALNSKALTAANTDIRPEDALGATNRALDALNTANYNGLGYTQFTSGNCRIGYAYQSSVTTSNGPIANPVEFALSGTDPCSGQVIPSANNFRTVPVGAAPIVIIANKTNASGLGSSAVSNITVSGTNNVAKLFACNASGQGSCNGSYVGASASLPVVVVQREPISGTMNTFEWTNVRLHATPTLSQETGVNGISGAFNPLSLTGSLGSRIRGIGTGDLVKGVESNTDSLGYVFFSYEALNTKTGGNAVNIKYLKLDGVDPLATSSSAGYTGAIPTCGSGSTFSCPITTTLSGSNGNILTASFYNLRQGTYRSWSEYRLISDGNGSNYANAQALVKQANVVAYKTLPDFVPFIAQCGSTSTHDDPGLSVYREHFTSWNDGRTVASTANDGPVPSSVSCTTGGSRTLTPRTYGGYSTSNNEAGGDVGGAIAYVAPGTKLTAPGPTGSHQ